MTGRRRFGVLLVVVLLGTVLGIVFNTPLVTRWLLGRQLASMDGVLVREIRIDRQRFFLPGRLELDGVELALEMNGKHLALAAPRIELTGLQSVIGRHRRVFISAEHAAGRYDQGSAGDMNIALTLKGNVLSGPVTAARAVWGQVEASRISSFVIRHMDSWEFRALKFAAFDGNISGKVHVQTASPLRYRAELFLTDVDIERMGTLSRNLPQKINGRLRGTLNVSGQGMRLDVLRSELMMPQGGRLSAAFLATLTQYLPQSREKKRLDLLIRRGGLLAMENFSFAIESVDHGKYAAEISLNSREINLDLNLTQDINTDGELGTLLEYWQLYLK